MGVCLAALVLAAPGASVTSVLPPGRGSGWLGPWRERAELRARAPVALGGPAQDQPQNTLGDRHLMVISYELECGQTMEVMIASDQVREDQILGDVRAWCPTCHTGHPVIRVRLQVR